VNDVIALSDSNDISSLGKKMAFTRMIKKAKYDVCFFLKPSSTKAVMALLAGIPERIGFAGKKAPLTKEVDMPSGGVHRADQLLALAAASGITKADGTYECFIREEERERAGAVLREAGGGAGKMIAMNPGGNWGPKRWPEDNFAGLAKRIIASYGDTEVVITGSEKDVELGNKIAEAVNDKKCYSVAGKTGLNELAAIFQKCELVVSADSGPLHLAAATGTTVIGIYGPTSHKITGPRGRGRSVVLAKDVGCEVPCYVEKCDKNYTCMRSITADEVFSAAQKELKADENR
jgi:lipopolysaccharide heptosyltransferase II